MKSFQAVLLALTVLISTSTPVNGHHSFAMFDKNAEMWLEGTVKELQWTNPHTFIQLMVTPVDESGEPIEGAEPVEWSLEGGSPNILARNGWNRLSVQPGDRVRVLIYPLASGEPGGSFLEIHKQDGTVLYYHG